MRQAPFYYHPRMLQYDFGPRHPLKPERLRRTIALLQAEEIQEISDPGPGLIDDALRVHSEEYLDALRSDQPSGRYGFGSMDNPLFPNMLTASLAYMAGTASAARDVRDGASMAFNLSGGLHHAQRSKASGFCILNDPAVAVHILRERFERVAYIDIDLHHGDGVQELFLDDPNVMTCSIHQNGRTLYPGTGFETEHGSAFTSINVPLVPHTTGDVWLWAFREGILTALDAFKPEAIVLQMGTDAHTLDPLGHLDVVAQEWLEAVKLIRDLRLPTVAVGGGGYNLSTVPRMWAAAVLTLIDRDVPTLLPDALAEEWGVHSYFDKLLPAPRGRGMKEAEKVADFISKEVIPNIVS